MYEHERFQNKKAVISHGQENDKESTLDPSLKLETSWLVTHKDVLSICFPKMCGIFLTVM